MPDPCHQPTSENGQQLKNDIFIDFLALVWLYRQKNRTWGLKIDDIKNIEPLFEIPELFTQSKHAAPALSIARFKTEYWNAKAAIYMPFVYDFLARKSVNNGCIPLVSKCINALIHSLEAFYDLPGERPIMCNIFGITHA